MTALGVLGGGAGGAAMGAAIQDGDFLGGLTGKKDKNKTSVTADKCETNFKGFSRSIGSKSGNDVQTYANALYTMCVNNEDNVSTDNPSSP